MAFIADKRQWRSAAEFEAHLAAHDPAIAPWAHGVVLHHTWAPTVGQWIGMLTMNSMQRYYERLGWDRGPHLYIVTGAQNPDNDGIWQMTPLNITGIHAGTANRWAWGVEVVGNYDVNTWSPSTAALVKATIIALMNWRGLTISRQTLIGHREVPSPKTCPGRFVDMHQVRTEFAFAQGMS
jgi:hypothetical protein